MLAEKMATMEAALKEELAELQEQEVDLYVERFQAAIEMEQRLAAIEEAMAKENQEVLLHQKILEMEALEARAHPEPADPRALLSAGDDEFTTRMKAEGLRHRSADGSEKRLTDRYTQRKNESRKKNGGSEKRLRERYNRDTTQREVYNTQRKEETRKRNASTAASRVQGICINAGIDENKDK